MSPEAGGGRGIGEEAATLPESAPTPESSDSFLEAWSKFLDEALMRQAARYKEAWKKLQAAPETSDNGNQ